MWTLRRAWRAAPDAAWAAWAEECGDPLLAAVARAVASVASPVGQAVGTWMVHAPPRRSCDPRAFVFDLPFHVAGAALWLPSRRRVGFAPGPHSLLARTRALWCATLRDLHARRLTDPADVVRYAHPHVRDACLGSQWLRVPPSGLGCADCVPTPRPLLRTLQGALLGGRERRREQVAVLALIVAVLVNGVMPPGVRDSPRHAAPSFRARRWGETTAVAVRGTPGARPAHCSVCDAGVRALKRCAACGAAAYCSRACQKRDWNVLGHPLLCSLWRALSADSTRRMGRHLASFRRLARDTPPQW